MQEVDREELKRIFDRVLEGRADTAFLKGLDVTVLLKLAGRLKKSEAARERAQIEATGADGEAAVLPAGNRPLRIAVLGSMSIQHFVSILRVFLKGAGIENEIYEGEYDGIAMDLLDESSAFYEFAPDMALILMDDRDIKSYPALLSSPEEVEAMVKKQTGYFFALWERIHRSLPDCLILQTNIVLPLTRQLSNLEAGCSYSRGAFIGRINNFLSWERPGFVRIMDMEYLASAIGKETWFDYSSYFLTKQGFGADCLGRVCALFAREISVIRGQGKKCLVLDLDNTLWGGVVGDDGWEGIQLDPHNAVGEAYRFFQSYILALKERGVILAVCSKNEESLAKEAFEKNPHMLLKLSDFAAFHANWEDKAGNIRQIAAELNIGVDSLVFVDDNPAERQIVRQFVPECLVVELPEDPAYYARALEESLAFHISELTREDLERAASYGANRERAKLMDSFVDYEEYLKALEMVYTIGEPDSEQLPRFAQLINKSNQFNLRTQRYSEAQLLGMQQDKDKALIYAQLRDRFTEYGIISCVILEKRERECFIDTWLMSCRVLKRRVEDEMLKAIRLKAIEMGCDCIRGEYIPSKKNMMVKDFYEKMGFERVSESEGTAQYLLSGLAFSAD